MQSFNWICTYCGHAQTVTDTTYSTDHVGIWNDGSRHGKLVCVIQSIVCSNPNCQEMSLKLYLFQRGASGEPKGKPIRSWPLLPESVAKPQPEYIPRSIVDNYTQACRITDLSPNASASLSRRCLQGMIRDYWGVAGEKNLWSEIQAIKEKVDSKTWEAIDSIRKFGNVGAHMKQDVNLLLDVEPGEAQALIELIEILFVEWYVGRHEREQRIATVLELGKRKQKQLRAVSTTTIEGAENVDVDTIQIQKETDADL